MSPIAETSGRSCACGDPLFGDRTTHDCCAMYGRRCPACAESRKAERKWLQISNICAECGQRSRFVGEICPPCERKIEESTS